MGTRRRSSSFGFESFLERERVLLSRMSGDPIVSGLRGEKEKRSTQSRLRVDPGFVSFDKLQEVGFSLYLGFILILNVLLMLRLNEAVRGRWIGPKTCDRIDIIFERKMEQPVTAPRAVWVVLSVLSCVNHVLV